MECIHIGSKIITLAIQMHGKVIDLDLSPEKNRIFEDIRLFSKAGQFEDVATNEIAERNILNKVNEMFQIDLTQPTLRLLNEYVEYSRPRYRGFLDLYGETESKKKVACSQFSNITFDKSLSVADQDTDFLNCFINKFWSRFQGFFVVSIHEKKDEGNYELLYPKLKTDTKNLNLLILEDFRKFADIFRSELPDLRAYSTVLPDPRLYIDDDKQIENDTTLTIEEKHRRIKGLRDDFYMLLSKWKLTLIENGNKIESIKLSVMIDLIKQIVGPSCKINLFDYSCNSVTIFVPERQRSAKMFVIPDDIEQGISRHWGGRKKPKKMKKLRFPKRYLPKILSKKDKKAQIKMLLKTKKQYKKNKYYTRKPLKSYKSKTSNHILNARKIYNIKNITPNAELAKKTGCKLSALKQIVKKGEGAYYSSGSRPNQTAKSWGLARLASSLTSGKAAAVDYNIIEKGCDHKKKAFILANKSRKKYKYGHTKTPKISV